MKKQRNEKPSRLLSLTLAFAMLFTLTVPAAAVDPAGLWGEGNISSYGTWALAKDGVLTITGNNNALPNYTSGALPPWSDHADKIQSVVITGCTAIGEQTFMACPNLTDVSLPEGLTKIGSQAFKNCSNLTSISLPEGLTYIDQMAFMNCSSLTSITLPESLTDLNRQAFDGSGLTEITFPSNLTYIGGAAFYNCKNLTEVTIPSTVTIINENAFQGCTALKTVTVQGCPTIGEQAFRGCTSLTDLTLENGVSAIGQLAFKDCIALTTVVFPGSLNFLSDWSFDGCAVLTEVTFQGSCDGYSNNTFANCPELTKLRYPYSKSSSWEGRSPSDFGALNAKLVAYGTTSLVTDAVGTPLDLSSGTGTLTITSSNIPFAPAEASKVENYSSGYPNLVDIASVSCAADAMSVELTLEKVSTYTSRATTGEVYINLDPAVFAAEIVDDTGAVIGDHSITFSATGLEFEDVDPVPSPDPDPDPDPIPTQDPTPAPDPDPDPILPDPDSSPEPTLEPNPSPSRPSSGGGSSSTPRPTVTERPFPEVVTPPEGEVTSPIQDIVGEEPRQDWVDRVQLPEYAQDLYQLLVSGSGSSHSGGSDSFADFLQEDSNFRLSTRVSPGEGHGYEVGQAETVAFSLLSPYANGTSVENGGLPSMVFTDGSYFTVDVSKADKAINYGTLRLGDMVRTDTFNGVFVTKLPKDENYEEKKKEASSYIGTVFQAFDMDHPEVFWLSGKCKLRILTAQEPGGTPTAYFFLTLVDNNGFTMCSPDWTANGAVAAGIARRDTAVKRILSEVGEGTTVEKLKTLNRILTESNEYNTTPDLTTIGNEPHECLSALEGRTGNNGPVCDGYSRAFKVLCDQLGIPCVLETGYAKPTDQSSGTYHMWNSVQVDGNWYGVDVTWNDPVYNGIKGAKSGKENEQYLLVGSATEIRGMTFALSHPVLNRAAEGGVVFNNGPLLSPVALSGLVFDDLPALPYDDVDETAWYHSAVAFVHEKGLMNGTGSAQFQPQGLITRQQAWMVLARLAGESPAHMEDARQWAMERGISDGTAPLGVLTREQLVTLLCRFDGHAGSESGLQSFPDRDSVAGYARASFGWAVERGIITGTSAGLLDPVGSATRAQFAAILQRYLLTAEQK